jgi:antitoxin VapB
LLLQKKTAIIDGYLLRFFNGESMDTARIFPSGRSQAVRLPKEYRFQGTDVIIKHFGNGVLLLPIDKSWAMLEAALAEFEPGFQLQREQSEEQIREEIVS